MVILRKMVGIDSVGVQYVYVWLYLILPFVVLAHLIGRYANRGVEQAAGSAKCTPQRGRSASIRDRADSRSARIRRPVRMRCCRPADCCWVFSSPCGLWYF